jgi:glycerol-3-phosphate dehydrogenase (NAD+)
MDDFDSNPQNSSEQLDKVCIIGSGNWGSAIATKIGRNCARLPFFEERVNMWVYEEMVDVDGCSEKQKLTEVINKRHENVKYLPGIPLPENIVAVADLAEACKDATLLVFVLPHQFLPRLLPVIRESAHPACRGVSLIKGIGKSFECFLSLMLNSVSSQMRVSLLFSTRLLQGKGYAHSHFARHCRSHGRWFRMWSPHGCQRCIRGG